MGQGPIGPPAFLVVCPKNGCGLEISCGPHHYKSASYVHGRNLTQSRNVSIILRITSMLVGVSYPRECYNIYDWSITAKQSNFKRELSCLCLYTARATQGQQCRAWKFKWEWLLKALHQVFHLHCEYSASGQIFSENDAFAEPSMLRCWEFAHTII
jgi:hypothetical protein